MILNELISSNVPLATTLDSIDYINSLFFATELEQIPVVESGQYFGLINIEELQQAKEEFKEITPHIYENFRPFISINAHPFDALNIMRLHDLSILPVLMDSMEYAGSILKEDLINYIIELISIDVSGGIIILEIEPRNYNLSQIAGIFESEQVLILLAQAKTNEHTAKIEVTIKANTTDLSPVIQSLERYDYTILHTFGIHTLESDAEDRYKLLMNYIYM